MSENDANDRDRCVLALVPTNIDAAVTRKLLSSNGIQLEICPTFDALIQELRFGAAAILLPEEVASKAHNTTLRAILAEQPPWSDLPVLILTKSGADSAALHEVLRTFGNVTVLERPLRAATLLSAVQTALRSRERQYQIRGHLADLQVSLGYWRRRFWCRRWLWRRGRYLCRRDDREDGQVQNRHH